MTHKTMCHSLAAAFLMCCLQAGCSDNAVPTTSGPLTPTSLPGNEGPQGLSAPSASVRHLAAADEEFNCTHLQEWHVRFSEPGYVNGNVVGLFYNYVGVHAGAAKLEIFWDEANEPTRTQYIILGPGEASPDGDLTNHTGVIQHVYKNITEPTKKVVRVNLICEGKTGNCATVRRITVAPSSGTNGTVTPSTPISCAAQLASNPASPDGVYLIDPDGAAGASTPISVHCDMTKDGGGWTRVVNIKNGSIFHGDQPAAVGDVSNVSAPAKLSDATINLLSTVGYWRYECLPSKDVFVKNASNTWTSTRYNAFSWSMDRDKDLIFECAANRGGYVFSDYPVCSLGHSNYVARYLSEGTGCYHNSWGHDGFLWAK